MTKQIELTQGQVVLVDDDVYQWASKHKWWASRRRKTWYAKRTVGVIPFRKTIILHREIMNAPPGAEVDHINGDGLDCRRANLRLATHAQNARNRGPQDTGSSGYKGVSEHSGKWQATIAVNGKNIYLGRFKTAKQAALAYDKAAKKYHGEYANTNF